MEEVTIKLPPLPEPPKGKAWHKITASCIDLEPGDLVLNGSKTGWVAYDETYDELQHRGICQGIAWMLGFFYRPLPVVEQPAPAVIFTDAEEFARVLADGTIQDAWSVAPLWRDRAHGQPEDHIEPFVYQVAKFAAFKYAECAEKDALIEKYRAAITGDVEPNLWAIKASESLCAWARKAMPPTEEDPNAVYALISEVERMNAALREATNV